MKSILLVSILCLIFYSCCKPGAQIKGQSNSDIETEILEIYSWLNLMPGTSDPSIHMTAKIRIKNMGRNPVKEITMKQIEILSDSLSLFLSDIDISSLETGLLKRGESREFNIKADKELRKVYSFDKPSTFYFYFISDDKMYKFEADNITIERVY